MGNVERILVIVIMATIVVILALAIWGLGQDEVTTSPYDPGSAISADKEVPVVERDAFARADAADGDLGVEIPFAPADSRPLPERRPIAEVAEFVPPARSATEAAAGPAAPAPAPGGAVLDSPIPGMRRYTVEKGDTFSTIAHKVLGDRNLWRQIEDANKDVDPRRLTVGMEILVPNAPDARRALPAAKAEPPIPSPLLLSAGKSLATPAGDPARRYVTKKGDTLFGIAKRELRDGKKWREIYEINRALLPSETVVPVGLTLTLPADSR